MQCEEVQEYLAERLAGSLSDRLSGTVHAYVRTHMLSCPECCEELEDFEEMQTVLRIIPLEPCDSTAMRARFDLLMGTKEAKAPRAPSTRLWPLPRAIRVLVAIAVSLAVVVVGVVIARRAGLKISFARVAAPVPVQPAKPVAVPVRTGAMSGQIRTANGELPGKIRIAVIAVSLAGTPSSTGPDRLAEIAGEANAEGHYRLENIPAGKYYVLATSIDPPTYYPGSPDVAGATIVSIQPGAVLEGIDFSRLVPAAKPVPPVVLQTKASASDRVVPENGGEVTDVQPLLVSVDVTVRLDTGGRLPYKPDTSIVFTGSKGTLRVAAFAVVGNLFRASIPVNDSYAVSVSNIAAGYSIQSVVDAAGTDLFHGGHVTLSSSPAAPPRIVVTLSKIN